MRVLMTVVVATVSSLLKCGRQCSDLDTHNQRSGRGWDQQGLHAAQPQAMAMFRFLGMFMGVAIRTGSPHSLNLAEPMWKQLAGVVLTPADITEVDRDYVPGLMCIRDMDGDKAFAAMDMAFSTPSAAGHEVHLSNRFRRVTVDNRAEYVCEAGPALHTARV